MGSMATPTVSMVLTPMVSMAPAVNLPCRPSRLALTGPGHSGYTGINTRPTPAPQSRNPYMPVEDFLSNVKRFKIIESTLREGEQYVGVDGGVGALMLTPTAADLQTLTLTRPRRLRLPRHWTSLASTISS